MTSHFTYVFAALTFASGLLSGIRAQSPPDYGPFDAARIGLPALTEELGRIDGKLGGYGEEIDRLKDEIEKRRKKIADLQTEAEDQAQEEAEFEKYKQTIRQQVEEIDRLADKHSLAATEKAKAGRVEDISALRADLTIILEASRFNALLGNEEKAIEQYKLP